MDLMKLAGLKECGLCCEIMSDDGKMMRTDELISFAEKYNIPYITVKDLQEYRKVFDNLVQCVSITNMPTKYGEFKAHCYINKLNGEHHIALVMGNISDGEAFYAVSIPNVLPEMFSDRSDATADSSWIKQ